jgi:hypothetical protein
MLTAYVNVLPFESVLRIWDIMLFDQSPRVLFRVMLTIVDANSKHMLSCTDSLELWDAVSKLPQRCVDSSALIDNAMLQFASADRYSVVLAGHMVSVDDLLLGTASKIASF